MNNNDDPLIEAIWQDLDGQVSREQISRVVAEISLEFQDAAVKAFVPIFVQRKAVEQLKRQLNENRLSANGRLSVSSGKAMGQSHHHESIYN